MTEVIRRRQYVSQHPVAAQVYLATVLGVLFNARRSNGLCRHNKAVSITGSA